MKILVDEMPLFEEDCHFADSFWDREEDNWSYWCELGFEGGCKCDLKDGKCSFLKPLKEDRGKDEQH